MSGWMNGCLYLIEKAGQYSDHLLRYVVPLSKENPKYSQRRPRPSPDSPLGEPFALTGEVQF